MLHSLQETKCDLLLLLPLVLPQPTQKKFKQQHPQQQQKATQFKYENSTKESECISVIYNTFLYAYMPHTYATVN